MRFNRNFRGRGINAQRTTAQRAIALLRSLGTSAHVWLPGANGVNVASLPSNNYLLSDGGTGYSTVDGVVGLDLDGMGSVGAEHITSIPSGNNGWTPSFSGGVASGVKVAGAATGSLYCLTTGMQAGQWYCMTVVVSAISGTLTPQIGVTPLTAITTVGTHVRYEKYTSGAANYLDAPAATTATVTSWSIKPITGTHLTQATTANKPLVRRGMFNDLLNSTTPATQSVTCIAAPYTLALYGAGNVVLSGTGAGTLTGTGASDLVVLNFTPTAGSVTFTKAGTVSSFGLFKGTWTAAQILAEGGIPTTTATAASNPSAGKYWWSLDGSNDSLLSGNLGITNACTIVIAGRVNAIGSYQVLLGEAANGVELVIDSLGRVYFSNTVIVMAITSGAVIVAGVPFVITMRLSAGTAVIRLNGVQVASAASAATFAAVTGARIGTYFNGTSHPVGGALGWVVPLPVALSDADCLTVERLVSSQFPNGPVF